MIQSPSLSLSQHSVLESVDYHFLVPFVEDECKHVGSKDDEYHHAEETDGLRDKQRKEQQGEY